jgi:hypothetical protein
LTPIPTKPGAFHPWYFSAITYIFARKHYCVKTSTTVIEIMPNDLPSLSWQAKRRKGNERKKDRKKKAGFKIKELESRSKRVLTYKTTIMIKIYKETGGNTRIKKKEKRKKKERNSARCFAFQKAYRGIKIWQNEIICSIRFGLSK